MGENHLPLPIVGRRSKIVQNERNSSHHQKKGWGESVVDHGEAGTPSENRPRGRTNTKMEAKRDVSTIALQETLKGFIPKG